jgi:CYTH domain-containing protein
MGVSNRQLRAAFGNVISLEGDGQTKLEMEYVFFGKIVDMSELEKAEGSETHEQWELRRFPKEGQRYHGAIRVRKTSSTTGRGKTDYELTLKTIDSESNVIGKQETEIDVTPDMFDQFRRLAANGMIKTRYFFPFQHEDQNLIWEVDVFKGRNGETSEWCKIDLEVQKPLSTIPPFPIQLTDVIDRQPNERTEEQNAFVKRLMEEELLQVNSYLPGNEN